MQFYFYIFAIVWVAAYVEFFHRKTWPLFPSMFIAFLFTSLRYETGNDWPTYKLIFDSVKPFFSSSFHDFLYVSKVYNKEVLFIIYNSLLKQICSDFQIVVVVSSGVYFLSFYSFLKSKTQYSATVFAISYSWLVFSLYFSTISQSLAIAFFLFFWVSFDKQRICFSVLSLILAPLFHVSAVLYCGIFFMTKRMISKKMVTVLWVVSLLHLVCVIVLHYDFVVLFLEKVLWVSAKLPTEVLFNKLNWYLYGRGLSPSTYDLFLVIFFTVVLGGWLVSSYDEYKIQSEQKDYLFALYFIFFQALFVNHVVYRYRLFYLAFPVLCIVIFRHYGRKKYPVRFAVLSVTCLASLAYVTLYLNKQNSITFVPYQNYVYYQLFKSNVSSDGNERTDEMLLNIRR